MTPSTSPPVRLDHRSRTVPIAAVRTYLGHVVLLLGGLTFLLGTGEGTVGALLVVIALALIALTVLTQRGHRVGLFGLRP